MGVATLIYALHRNATVFFNFLIMYLGIMVVSLLLVLLTTVSAVAAGSCEEDGTCEKDTR